jgi:glutathione S-transferase
MDMVHAVIGLAVLQFFVFAGFVGRARVKSGVEAPAVTGDPLFERYYRVHYNTMEQLVIFIPAILLFATYIDTLWAAILGLIYVVGRIVYFRAYIADPAKRGAGYGVSMLPVIILLLGGLGGAGWAVLSG